MHLDAEFSTLEDLIAATFTGRNLGWLPGQKAEAIHHIATVVRSDNGQNSPAQQFDGQPYRILFTGTDPAIPEEFRLTSEFRVAVDSGTDQQIFDAVVKVVAAYVNSLRFSKQDDNGNPIRSPFDTLQISLPSQPAADESPDYSRRFCSPAEARTKRHLAVCNGKSKHLDGQLQFHDQDFTLACMNCGLKIFLAEPPIQQPAATA